MKTENPSVGSLNEVLLTRVTFADDNFRGAAIAVGIRLSLGVEGREESKQSVEM